MYREPDAQLLIKQNMELQQEIDKLRKNRKSSIFNAFVTLALCYLLFYLGAVLKQQSIEMRKYPLKCKVKYYEPEVLRYTGPKDFLECEE